MILHACSYCMIASTPDEWTPFDLGGANKNKYLLRKQKPPPQYNKQLELF